MEHTLLHSRFLALNLLNALHHVRAYSLIDLELLENQTIFVGRGTGDFVVFECYDDLLKDKRCYGIQYNECHSDFPSVGIVLLPLRSSARSHVFFLSADHPSSYVPYAHCSPFKHLPFAVSPTSYYRRVDSGSVESIYGELERLAHA